MRSHALSPAPSSAVRNPLSGCSMEAHGTVGCRRTRGPPICADKQLKEYLRLLQLPKCR